MNSTFYLNNFTMIPFYGRRSPALGRYFNEYMDNHYSTRLSIDRVPYHFNVLFSNLVDNYRCRCTWMGSWCQQLKIRVSSAWIDFKYMNKRRRMETTKVELYLFNLIECQLLSPAEVLTMIPYNISLKDGYKILFMELYRK